MLYWKPSRRSNNNFLSIIVISLLTGTAVNIILHLLLYNSWNIFHKGSTNSALYFVVTGALLILASVLTYYLLGKGWVGKAYVRELNVLKDFTDELHGVASEEEAYDVLCCFLRKIPSIERVVVFSRNLSAQDQDSWQCTQYGDPPVCNMSTKKCSLIESGKEYVVNCLKESSQRCHCQSDEFTKGSLACIPIVFTKNSHLILQLYSSQSGVFNLLTLFKIKTYVEIAYPVIGGKKTIQALNKKANTDRLTNLYNKSFLEPYLENQLEAANLTRQQVSLLMVDMDHFKKINDTFGHITGDYILTIFAEIIHSCIRKTDLVARYGGDEFIVVLPSTNTETAEAIARRIIDTVAQVKIPPLGNVEIPPITCSVGISTYPDHCSTKNDLIKTSDIALYSAKQSGRNCLRTFNCSFLTS